jgi:MFS family permease
MSAPAAIDTDHSLHVMRRALFLSSFPIGVLTLGIPIYAPTKLGSDAVQVGMLVSIYALMTLIMRPIVGPAMDRYGRRRFFVAGLALQLGSNAFFAAGSSFDWLFWGRLAQGVSAGLVWLSAYAITADLAAGGRHGNMFGSVEEMLARGGLYGAVIGAPILMLTRFEPLAWSGVFAFYGVLNAIGLVLAWRGLPETYHKSAQPQRGNGSTITRSLILLAAIVLCTSTAYNGLGPILIQFVQREINSDPIVLGLMYLPSAIVFGFFQSRLGRVADRVGRKLPIAIGLSTSGLSSAIVPSLPLLAPMIGQWVLLPLVALWVAEAVAFSAATPAEQALVADLSGGASRGKAFGLYTTSLSLGQAIGPTLGGILYESLGHSAPFYFNTVVLWLGAAMMALLIPDTYRRPMPVAASMPPHEPPAQWPGAGGSK